MKRTGQIVSATIMLAVGLCGCSSGKAEPAGTATTAPAQLAAHPSPAEVVAGLGCANVDVVASDIWFYDDAIGVNCDLANGDHVYVRRYAHAESVLQALADSPPVSLVGTRVLLGDGWYAAGPTEAIESINAAMPGAGQPVALTDLPEPKAMTKEQSSLTFCIRTVNGGILQSISEPKEWAKITAEVRPAYPGLNERVTELATAALRTEPTPIPTGINEDSSKLFVAVSRMGTEVRDYCKSVTSSE